MAWAQVWRGVALAVGLGGAMGSAPPGDGWQEVRWPFPRDGWAPGRAFQCGATACGGDVTLFLRAKRGICANCATGVTDDAEVDAVADLDMLSADFRPSGTGEQVRLGEMAGRMRAYRLLAVDGTRVPATGYLVSRIRQCDLLAVATQGRDADTPAARSAVAGFLQSGPAVMWISRQMDGR